MRSLNLTPKEMEEARLLGFSFRSQKGGKFRSLRFKDLGLLTRADVKRLQHMILTHKRESKDGYAVKQATPPPKPIPIVVANRSLIYGLTAFCPDCGIKHYQVNRGLLECWNCGKIFNIAI
jgi:hypothetical protein